MKKNRWLVPTIILSLPLFSHAQETGNNTSGRGPDILINNTKECTENATNLLKLRSEFNKKVNKLRSKEVQHQRLSFKDSLMLLNQYSVNYNLANDTSAPEYQPDRECDCGDLNRMKIKAFEKDLKAIREARSIHYNCTRGQYVEFENGQKVIKNRYKDDENYRIENFWINALIILYEQY